eukprot:6454526-Amphidinium_carterae.1
MTQRQADLGSCREVATAPLVDGDERIGHAPTFAAYPGTGPDGVMAAGDLDIAPIDAAHVAAVQALFQNITVGQGWVTVAVITKVLWWSTNHHTRSGGHAVEKEEAPTLLSKTFELMGLWSFRPFLDGAWFCGHVMSTHCNLSQVYSAAALMPGKSQDQPETAGLLVRTAQCIGPNRPGLQTLP